MSRHHENITWQSADGTWSSGFYDIDHRPDDPDDEWGVEFSSTRFQWVSTGHATQGEANRAWTGSNPGSRWVVSYSKTTAAEALELDMIAADLEDRDRAEQERDRQNGIRTSYWGGREFGYEGPDRTKDRELLRARVAKAGRDVAIETREAHRHRIEGYANDHTSRIAALTAQRDALIARARAAGARKLDDGSELMLKELRELREKVTAPKAGWTPSRWGMMDRERHLGQARHSGLAQLDDQIAQLVEASAKTAARSTVGKAASTRAANAGSTPAKSSTTGRVRAGVPAGGQFAATSHSEATSVRLPPR